MVRRIAVLGSDSGWSNLMAFHPEEYDNGDDFLERVKQAPGSVVRFANDGETFGHHHRDKQWFINFVMLTMVLAGLNWLLVLFATETLLAYYIYAIIGVTLVISVVNYYLNKIWVFKAD